MAFLTQCAGQLEIFETIPSGLSGPKSLSEYRNGLPFCGDSVGTLDAVCNSAQSRISPRGLSGPEKSKADTKLMIEHTRRLVQKVKKERYVDEEVVAYAVHQGGPSVKNADVRLRLLEPIRVGVFLCLLGTFAK